jgi:hypothetical protein
VHSLLYYITLLALISYTTQIQAGLGFLTGEQSPDSYARKYIDEIASNEGLSELTWYPDGIEDYSFAEVTYNKEKGFMKGIPRNDEAETFEVSIVNII